jgi:hypothetical protein
MNELRDKLIEALAEFDDIGVPWESAEYDYAGAVDAVLRVLAEHGDTGQVREQIQGLVIDLVTHARPVTTADFMAVVASLVAARDAANERAQRREDEALFFKKKYESECKSVNRREADLAAARQQLERVRAKVTDAVAEHRNGDTVPVGAVMAALVVSDQPPSEDDIWRGREVQAILDAPPAGEAR